jgi:uncharacterized DUF497 family protein
LTWAPAAQKHGIARERVRHVIESAHATFWVPDEGGDPDPALLLFVGDDPNGVPLEVIVRILNEETLRVIHAMRMRRKYREQYETATRVTR